MGSVSIYIAHLIFGISVRAIAEQFGADVARITTDITIVQQNPHQLVAA